MERGATEALIRYYAATAGGYDAEHGLEPEHVAALSLVAGELRRLGARRVLDVGCGTGRATRLLAAWCPDVQFVGVDLSRDLLRVAVDGHGLDSRSLCRADAVRLPFRDGAVDAAVAVALLHHVPHPWPVVAEMLRVSRQAIFISDVNIYGQGRLPARVVKTGARLVGLSRLLNRVRHGRAGYFVTEGDGVVFPFSLLDVVPQLTPTCPWIATVPTRGTRGMHAFPLGAASALLVCGFKRKADLGETRLGATPPACNGEAS